MSTNLQCTSAAGVYLWQQRGVFSPSKSPPTKGENCTRGDQLLGGGGVGVDSPHLLFVSDTAFGSCPKTRCTIRISFCLLEMTGCQGCRETQAADIQQLSECRIIYLMNKPAHRSRKLLVNRKRKNKLLP